MKKEPARIAIVEDNRTTRESLLALIEMEEDLTCVCVSETAEEAIDAIARHRPQLVLMDIQLPKMSGVQCAEILKEAIPDILIMMVTVYEDTDLIFSALRSGACGYLLKRSTPEEILAGIRDVLSGGVPMTGDVARKVIAQFRKPVELSDEIGTLSEREHEILKLVARGYSNKEIANRINLSVETIRWHLKHIYDKLHVHSRTEAAMKLREGGSAY